MTLVEPFKDFILEFIHQHNKYLKDHFHIRRIGIFGSFARNEQTAESDIDIIIELEENTQNIYELKKELRDFFKKEFGQDVDIAREKYLKPYVKNQIIAETVYI